MNFADLITALEGLGNAATPLIAQHFEAHGVGDVPLLLGTLPPKQSLKSIEAELAIDPALIAQSLPHVGDRLETLALLADVPLTTLKIRARRFKLPIGPRPIFQALAQHWDVPFHQAVGRYYDFPFQPVPPMNDKPKPPYEWDWPGARIQLGYGKAIGTDGRDWSEALADHADFAGHVEAMVVADGLGKADLKKALAAGKGAARIIVHRVFAGEAPRHFEQATQMNVLDFSTAPPGVSSAIAKGDNWVRVTQPARRVTLAVTGYEQKGKALILSLAADKEGTLVPLAKASVTGALAKQMLAHGKAHGTTRHGPIRAFDPFGPLPSLLCRATALEPAPRRKAGCWLTQVTPIGPTDRLPDPLEDIVQAFT